jgi:hypothetical protein
MVQPRQKDARGQNNKINYGMDTKGEKKKTGRPRKTWMEGVQAAMTARNLEQDQWRNGEKWRLVYGTRRQLLFMNTTTKNFANLGLYIHRAY